MPVLMCPVGKESYCRAHHFHIELQNRLLVPAINGLVIPAVALLFATMTSTTISTLRQRQVDVRRAINMEAGELRSIECLLDAIEEGPVQDQCRDYVSES